MIQRTILANCSLVAFCAGSFLQYPKNKKLGIKVGYLKRNNIEKDHKVVEESSHSPTTFLSRCFSSIFFNKKHKQYRIQYDLVSNRQLNQRQNRKQF